MRRNSYGVDFHELHGNCCDTIINSCLFGIQCLSCRPQLYGRSEDASSNTQRSLCRKWMVADGVNSLTTESSWTRWSVRGRPSSADVECRRCLIYSMKPTFGDVHRSVFSAFVYERIVPTIVKYVLRLSMLLALNFDRQKLHLFRIYLKFW